MERKKVKEHYHDELSYLPGVVEVTYQPGNCTLYDIFFSDVGDSWVMSWPTLSHGGVSMLIRKDGVLHHSYMEEKLPKLQEGDVAALLILVMEETGRPVVLPPNYNRQGLWEHGAPGGLVEREVSNES
jgi:hypothetical protein